MTCVKRFRNFEHLPREILADAITTVLSNKQREYALLYFFMGMKMSDIAKSQGVSTSAVSRTISRAKKKLEQVLKYV